MPRRLRGDMRSDRRIVPGGNFLQVGEMPPVAAELHRITLRPLRPVHRGPDLPESYSAAEGGFPDEP